MALLHAPNRRPTARSSLRTRRAIIPTPPKRPHPIVEAKRLNNNTVRVIVQNPVTGEKRTHIVHVNQLSAEQRKAILAHWKNKRGKTINQHLMGALMDPHAAVFIAKLLFGI